MITEHRPLSYKTDVLNVAKEVYAVLAEKGSRSFTIIAGTPFEIPLTLVNVSPEDALMTYTVALPAQSEGKPRPSLKGIEAKLEDTTLVIKGNEPGNYVLNIFLAHKLFPGVWGDPRDNVLDLNIEVV